MKLWPALFLLVSPATAEAPAKAQAPVFMQVGPDLFRKVGTYTYDADPDVMVLFCIAETGKVYIRCAALIRDSLIVLRTLETEHRT